MAVSVIKEINANVLGAAVDITSYTNTSSPFVCPHDGYVVANAGSASTAKAVGRILGTSNNLAFGAWGNGTFMVMPLFVRRGTKVIRVTAENGGTIQYIPLT